MGKVADALEKAGFGEGRGSENRPVAPVREKTVVPKQSLRQSHIQGAGTARKDWDDRLLKVLNGDGHVAEIFKTLRARILHPQRDRPIPKTIMVTSAIPKEGKSFVSANLAIALAQGMDQYSMLIDCDLRRPSLAGMFGMDGSRGLVEYLEGHLDLAETIQKSPVPKLAILPSGTPPDNPAELLGSARMSGLVTELSSRYEDRFIIFDSPPMQVASESTVLAGQVDAVIVVVRQGGAGKPQVQRLIDIIGPQRILGIVFNVHTTNMIENAFMKDYRYYQTYS